MKLERKPILLNPIYPNMGVSAWYRARLNEIIREVRNEVNLEVERYKDVKPEKVIFDGIAKDNHPLADAISALMVRWLDKITGRSEKLAKEFVANNLRHYDNNLKRQLRRENIGVNFRMTEAMQNALQESMSTNVGLIHSIPNQYLNKVEEYVYDAMSSGFDLHALTNNLQRAYHISRNRASIIAKDQARKANSVIEKARRMELGIKKAMWVHSHAAREPRISHLRAHGKVFEVEKGCLIDGEYIQAGEKINCGCVSKSIIEY